MSNPVSSLLKGLEQLHCLENKDDFFPSVPFKAFTSGSDVLQVFSLMSQCFGSCTLHSRTSLTTLLPSQASPCASPHFVTLQTPTEMSRPSVEITLSGELSLVHWTVSHSLLFMAVIRTNRSTCLPLCTVIIRDLHLTASPLSDHEPHRAVAIS